MVIGKSCAKMPGKPDTDDWRVERGEQIQFQSSIYSHHQPWWRGVGENASKSSSDDQLNGSIVNGITRSETNDKSGVCILAGILFDFCFIIM